MVQHLLKGTLPQGNMKEIAGGQVQGWGFFWTYENGSLSMPGSLLESKGQPEH